VIYKIVYYFICCVYIGIISIQIQYNIQYTQMKMLKYIKYKMFKYFNLFSIYQTQQNRIVIIIIYKMCITLIPHFLPIVQTVGGIIFYLELNKKYLTRCWEYFSKTCRYIFINRTNRFWNIVCQSIVINSVSSVVRLDGNR